MGAAGALTASLIQMARGLLWPARNLYGLVARWGFPPPDFPRYRGAELVVNITSTIARLGTVAVVYGLLLYVATRPYAKARPGRA